MQKHIKTIASNLKQMNIAMPTQQAVEKMLRFLTLLEKWNRAYNLTAITDFDKMLTHHLLDSLSIVSFVQGERIIDVGTGAGLPGIPLALYFPEKQFVLLDSIGKKTRFLTQVKNELEIDNLEVVQARVEKFTRESCFDAIIFRAVGNMSDLICKANHLLCKNGQFLFMKGSYPETELQELKDWKIQVEKIHIPAISSDRHLIIIEG